MTEVHIRQYGTKVAAATSSELIEAATLLDWPRWSPPATARRVARLVAGLVARAKLVEIEEQAEREKGRRRD